MEANKRQIGGNHYKATFQHWDLVEYLQFPYLFGQVTRYVARWRKKNGMEDLEKALHYMDKLMESEKQRTNTDLTLMSEFLEEHSFHPNEVAVFRKLLEYHLGDEEILQDARDSILKLINDAKLINKLDVPNNEDPEFKDSGDEWRR